MSKVKIEGNASGTGTLTISAPNTNVDRSLTLPDTAGEFVTADDSGDVTISGNVDVTGEIQVNHSTNTGIKFTHTNGSDSALRQTSTGSLILEADVNNETSDSRIQFQVDGTENMRINSDGHLLVGKTSTDQSIAGTTLFSDGRVATTGDGEATLYVNRTTSDGGLIILRRNGNDKGYIGIVNNELFIVTPTGSDSGLNFGSNRIIPCTTTGTNRDNIIDLGNSASRFDDIYATNTSIQTSDQNEKQQIASLTDAEMNVAKRLSALFKTFKWNSSVEEKGDNARTHTGIIAQDMQQAFTDEGLDAGNYAMFISSTWWEKEISVDAVEEETDEEGNVITEGKDAYTYMDSKYEATEGYTEKTRLGVRYPELFAFINAYNDQRFEALETRIEALENA